MDQASLAYSYSQEAVSAAVVDQLKRTRGWVLFFSVLMWIGAIFLVFGGIMMIGMGIFAGATGGFGKELSQEFAAMGGMAAIGVVYLVLAIFYFYPAIKLGKFAARIRDLASAPSERNLVAALNEQRAFWKYVGIMMIVFFVLYFVAIIIGIAVGVMGAAAANMN